MFRVQRGQSVIQQVKEYTLHGKHNWVIVSYLNNVHEEKLQKKI